MLKLEIPPLRARPGDIGLCAEQFLERLNGMSGEAERHMTPEFLAGLTEYGWPGNVRELQNTIERTFYSSAGEELDAQSLRSALGPAPESAPLLTHTAARPASCSPRSPSAAATWARPPRSSASPAPPSTATSSAAA